MEGCREKDAAQKLADWYGVQETKTPTHIEPGRKQTELQKGYQDDSTLSGSVKYMASIDLWFDETFKPLPDEEGENYWKRVRKSVKSQLVLSYKAGQKGR